jgi:asparagine synthase (glutamine-hydrolysing)
VKALFVDPNVPRRIDPKGIDQTFTYWASVAPTTVFEEVEELPPGSFRVYERNGSHRDVIFWRPAFPEVDPRERAKPNHLKIEDATEILREKIRRATEIRTVRADVPIGCYLSGGLDSSVAAWMGRLASRGEFKTFSVRFEEDEFDESSYQRLMVSMLGSQHEECTVTRREIAAVFPEIVYHAERPVLRTAAAPLYLLSGMVNRCGFKSVITGEGADEMIGGYDLFREAKIRMFLASQPNSLVRARLFERLYPYLARSPRAAIGMGVEFWKLGLDRVGSPGFSHLPRWSTTSLLKRFLSDEMKKGNPSRPGFDVLDSLPDGFSRWDPLAQAQYLEIVTLLSGYLISTQGDRMLMAHSVEGRFPFLDIDVMKFCNDLPAEYKLIGLNEKHILKRVARGFLPEKIINRKKQPYRSPDAICFLGPGAPAYVHEMFSEESLRKSGIFSPRPVRELYEKCRKKFMEGSVPMAMSNIDNAGFVGILSTQLLYHGLVSSSACVTGEEIHFTTCIDRAYALSS